MINQAPVLRPRKKRHALSISRIIALTFLGIIVTGALLLGLPFASRNGRSAGLITSLFTATSVRLLS